MFRHVLALSAVSFVGFASTAIAGPNDKVTYCHNTGSETNPWVVITTSQSAYDAHVANHGDHKGYGYNEAKELQCQPRKCDVFELVKGNEPTNVWDVRGETRFRVYDKAATLDTKGSLYLDELIDDRATRISEFDLRPAEKAVSTFEFNPGDAVLAHDEKTVTLRDAYGEAIRFEPAISTFASVELYGPGGVLCVGEIRDEVYYKAAPQPDPQ